MMYGHLFAGLNQLKFAYLLSNECIDENFRDENEISTLSQIVADKCDVAQ